MKRLEMNVRGRVQGVGYRAWTRRKAQQMGLKGYVKNLRDGSVEVVAEGKESKLKEFERECRRGSLTAKVKSADADYKDATGEFKRFNIEF